MASWNIRGCNQPLKQKEMKYFLNKNSIDIVGFFETRVKEAKHNQILKKFGNSWEWCNNYHYSGKGRIWFGWNIEKVKGDISFVSAQVIHGRFSHNSISVEISMVYGLHNINDRKELWEELEKLGDSVQGPWLIMGDFNTIYESDQRQGGSVVTDKEMEDFLDCIQKVRISPLKY